jgi:hypothetical protein
MGYGGFEDDIELLTKALPKDKDGAVVDLKCACYLLELVEAHKQIVAETAPSVSTQTQAP